MGNWLVNHWFSAAVLVSVWGWGGSSARRVWGNARGYGGHSLGPGGLMEEMGADLLSCGWAVGKTSSTSAGPTCKSLAPREGWGSENLRLKENTTQMKWGVPLQN